MRGFTVVDLTPQCQVRSKARYEYELLEQVNGAAELLGDVTSLLANNPEAFEAKLADSIFLRWRASSQTTGIAAVRDESERTLSLSIVASGLEPESDHLTLTAFQDHAVRELRDGPYEPSFDLVNLPERPLLASIGLILPPVQHRWPFALADRCFAAAYFRRLGLA